MTQIDPLSLGMIGSSERGSSFLAIVKRPPAAPPPVPSAVSAGAVAPPPVSAGGGGAAASSSSPPQAARKPGRARSAPPAVKRVSSCFRVISSLTKRGNGSLLMLSLLSFPESLSPRWDRRADYKRDPDRRGVAKRVRRLGAVARHVTLREPVHLRAEQKLDLAEQDIGELLSGVADHVILVASSRLERQQCRLDRVAVAAPEKLVADSAAALHSGNSRGALADDLDRLRALIGAVDVGQQVGDVEAEVLRDDLQPMERDATAVVLQVGERRGRDTDLAGKLAQPDTSLDPKTADPLPEDDARCIVGATRRGSPNGSIRRSSVANIQRGGPAPKRPARGGAELGGGGGVEGGVGPGGRREGGGVRHDLGRVEPARGDQPEEVRPVVR